MVLRFSSFYFLFMKIMWFAVCGGNHDKHRKWTLCALPQTTTHVFEVNYHHPTIENRKQTATSPSLPYPFDASMTIVQSYQVDVKYTNILVRQHCLALSSHTYAGVYDGWKVSAVPSYWFLEEGNISCSPRFWGFGDVLLGARSGPWIGVRRLRRW